MGMSAPPNFALTISNLKTTLVCLDGFPLSLFVHFEPQ